LLSRAAASRAALARCRGMDGERMHAALELGDKGFVDHAVALEPALPAERLSHDIYTLKCVSPPSRCPACPACWWDSSTTSSRAGSKALVNFSAMRSRLAMASA
jgi:hypothetical protein